MTSTNRLLPPGSPLRPLYLVLSAAPDDEGCVHIKPLYAGGTRLDAWHAYEQGKAIAQAGDAAVAIYRDILSKRPRRVGFFRSATWRREIVALVMQRLGTALQSVGEAVGLGLA